MQRPTPALMIQATGSNAGKSTIVAGLARALVRRGLEGGAVQAAEHVEQCRRCGRRRRDRPRPGGAGARGAGAAQRAHEPGAAEAGDRHRRADHRAGQALGHAARATIICDKKAALLPAVLESFAHLARDADIVLVEGAGSPAEINLRAGDIANMGFAAAADVPVVMLGDIDRGGVIASLVGTHLVSGAGRAGAHPRLHRSTSFAAMSDLFERGPDARSRAHRLALARRRAVVAAGGMAAGRGCGRSRSQRMSSSASA